VRYQRALPDLPGKGRATDTQGARQLQCDCGAATTPYPRPKRCRCGKTRIDTTAKGGRLTLQRHVTMIIAIFALQ